MKDSNLAYDLNAIEAARPEGKIVPFPARSVRARRLSVAGLGASAFVLADKAAATGTSITLPDNGVDEAGFITTVIADFGAVAAVVVGGYMTYLIVRKAMSYAGKAIR